MSLVVVTFEFTNYKTGPLPRSHAHLQACPRVGELVNFGGPARGVPDDKDYVVKSVTHKVNVSRPHEPISVLVRLAIEGKDS